MTLKKSHFIALVLLLIVSSFHDFPSAWAKSRPLLSEIPVTSWVSCVLLFPNERSRESAVEKIIPFGFEAKKIEPRTSKGFQLEVGSPVHQESEIRKILSPTIVPFKGEILSCKNQIPDTQPIIPTIQEKPVIYLYPPQPQEIEVRLDYQGRLTTTYPDYDQKIRGWKVQAFPNGRLIDLRDRQEYSYLFWEGIPDSPITWDRSKGFVVPGKETKTFLQEILAKKGLTPREYNEFIVYWLPRMEKNPYNLIHFIEEEYTRSAPLEISPRPDSVLRIFMVFQGLETPTSVEPQEIKPFERKGFAVVEWGGSESP